MLANDLKQRLVGKALLVVANRCGRVNAGQDCRLSGSALRPPFDSQTCVGANKSAVIEQLGFFILKDSQGLCIFEAIEWIVWTSSTDPQTIDEEEKHRHERDE